MKSLLSAMAVASITLLVGCGSGGGGGAGASNGGGNNGGAGSDAERSAAINAIETEFGGYDGSDQDQENSRMLAFVQKRPEFTATGLTDGAVWAQFKDGSTLVVCNNLDPSPPTRAAKSRAGSSSEIPASLNVILGASLGTTYEAANNDIAAMFDSKVYSRAARFYG